MSQKTCSKCAMAIPNAAKICPYCRKPQGWTLPAKIFAWVFGLTLFSAIGDNIFKNHPQQSATPDEVQRKELNRKVDEERTTRALSGAMTLKRAMRNPDSFKLTSATVMKDGTACYEYRSQNGFGGMNSGRAILAGRGDAILTSDMEGFYSRWDKKCAGKSGDDVVDYLELALR